MARSRESIDLSAEVRNAAIVTRAREITRESVVILQKTSQPDTFLGRKTQEPFPAEQTHKLAP